MTIVNKHKQAIALRYECTSPLFDFSVVRFLSRMTNKCLFFFQMAAFHDILRFHTEFHIIFAAAQITQRLLQSWKCSKCPNVKLIVAKYTFCLPKEKCLEYILKCVSVSIWIHPCTCSAFMANSLIKREYDVLKKVTENSRRTYSLHTKPANNFLLFYHSLELHSTLERQVLFFQS